MEKTYRVSLEIDFSAMDVVLDGNIMTICLEVKEDCATAAAYSAVRRFAEDFEVISIVPVREG